MTELGEVQNIVDNLQGGESSEGWGSWLLLRIDVCLLGKPSYGGEQLMDIAANGTEDVLSVKWH